MLKRGDKVKVFLPVSEQTISDAVRAFNGTETTIKNIFFTKKGRPQFTLNGCQSRYGNDYFFVEEWLVPLIEESEETI